MTGIYNDNPLFSSGIPRSSSFSLRGHLSTRSVTTCQRMKTSRLFISSLQVHHPLAFQITGSSYWQPPSPLRTCRVHSASLLKALSAPDIYSKSCFIHLRTSAPARSSANFSESTGPADYPHNKYPISSSILSAVLFPAPDIPVTITSLMQIRPLTFFTSGSRSYAGILLFYADPAPCLISSSTISAAVA